MADLCPSASSQAWNHDSHDKCLGTPWTEDRSAKRAAQEEHPTPTTSQTGACVVRVSQRAPAPGAKLSTPKHAKQLTTIPVLQKWRFGLAAFIFWTSWTLLSHDRRQSTPASSLQTYLTTGVCLSTLLFQARRPSEHTFHFKCMNCSTQW